ncbi:MAG TPA: hypothetical protein VE783_08980 [Candidatus Limnocylindrales bacterium]|nr:hypothetical protein [Candidatus Limnocylindrales bacterium]
MTRFWFFLATLVVGVRGVSAQPAKSAESAPQRVLVGDPQINGTGFKPYKNLWRTRLTHPDGKTLEMGSWSDLLTADKLNGREVLRRTQISLTPEAFTMTINTFDAHTLAPISTDWGPVGPDGGISPERHFHRDFNGSQIHVHVVSPQVPSGVRDDQTKLETAPFDFYGGMYGLILAALPLKEGYSGTFPSVLEFQEKQDWVSFRVAGKERLDAGQKGAVETWKIDATTAFGKMYFWITQEPPYIIKLVNVTPKGDTWSWEMV